MKALFYLTYIVTNELALRGNLLLILFFFIGL